MVERDPAEVVDVSDEPEAESVDDGGASEEAAEEIEGQEETFEASDEATDTPGE